MKIRRKLLAMLVATTFIFVPSASCRSSVNPKGNPPGGGPGGGFGGGHSSANIDYSGSVEITSAATETNKTYSTSTVDQSSLLISTSDNVTITNPTVSKTGDSNGGDSCNFYGLNAGWKWW